MPVLASSVDLVVVRAFVVRTGRVLLVRRAAWDTFPGRWELPGGKVDADEPPELALSRELREETALRTTGAGRARGDQVLRSPSGRRVLERVYEVPVTGTIALSDEHDDFVWHELSGALPAPLTPAALHALRYR